MDTKAIQQLAEQLAKEQFPDDKWGRKVWSDGFEAGAADKGLVLKDGLIEYIYDFAWHYGRLFHLGSAEKIKQAIQEHFQLPEEWLEEDPSPTSLADWSVLAKIAPPEKWVEMYQHYQELLVAADTAAFWKEQYDIANAERNTLKHPEATVSQTIPEFKALEACLLGAESAKAIIDNLTNWQLYDGAVDCYNNLVEGIEAAKAALQGEAISRPIVAEKENCGRESCVNKDCDECFKIANENWWRKEQFDIANAEGNVLKQQEATSQTIPNSNH
jgi:hypothetical protein